MYAKHGNLDEKHNSNDSTMTSYNAPHDSAPNVKLTHKQFSLITFSLLTSLNFSKRLEISVACSIQTITNIVYR